MKSFYCNVSALFNFHKRRKTFFLHVGPHKTGSTYLQVEFSNHAEACKAQNILYPEVGREGSYGHHNVARFFCGRPLVDTTSEQIYANLLDLTQACQDQLLMSSEIFMRLSATDLNKLRLCFNTYDFHVIYFKRTGSSMVVSLWQELVKHGLTTPLDELYSDTLVEELSYNPFAHEDNISKLENGLGGKVTVFDYDELRTQGTDVFDATCDVLGIKLNANARAVNPGMSFATVELTRAANLYAKSLGRNPGTRPREVVLSFLLGSSGAALAEHVNEKLAALAKPLPSGSFAEAGFFHGGIVDETASNEIRCIPANRLLEALNKDDMAPWQELKDWIRAGKKVQN